MWARIAVLSLCLGIGQIVSGDPAASQEVVTFSDFSGGLNTRRAPVLLADNESPSLENVVLDKSGAITRREGHTRLNATALNTAAEGQGDVQAVFQLEQSDGDNFCVAFSSTSGYSSTDGCATFTLFLTSITRNNDVNCDAFNDRLYCVSDAYNFSFDGVDDAAFDGPPDLNYIRTHRTRCFGAGSGANPSRLFFSDLGDCETWNQNISFIDISPEDGDVITGIGEPFFDTLPIYKKFSTWLLKGTSPDDFSLTNISKNTGALNHRSIRNYNNLQIFDSVGYLGGQPGIYGFNGVVIREISGKLRNDIDELDTFSASAGRKAIDTFAEWNAGAFNPKEISTTRNPGFLQSTFTVFLETTQDDFDRGVTVRLSTSIFSGSLTLETTEFIENWSDGDTTSNPPWQSGGGAFTIDANRWAHGNTGGIDDRLFLPNMVHSTGTWEFRYQFDSCTAGNFAFGFVADGSSIGGPSYTGYRLQFLIGANTTRQIGKNASTILVADIAPCDNDEHIATITRESNGAITWYEDGLFISSAVDTEHTASERLILESDRTELKITDISIPVSSGIYTSKGFEVEISTPIWGLMSPFVRTTNLIPDSTATYTFESAVAETCAGPFDSFLPVAPFEEIPSSGTTKSCIKYRAVIQTTHPFVRTGFFSPELFSNTITAASTGTYDTGETFLSNSIGVWGQFQCTEEVSGFEASTAYAIRTSTFQGGTLSENAGFELLTCGNTITTSTGAYIVIVATLTIGVATETARVDALVINWTEGTGARSASAAVFKNRYHYGAQSAGGVRNDVMYILDLNAAWVKWTGITPRFLNIVDQKFTVGDSRDSGGGFVFNFYDTDADDGAAISSFYETKDFTLGSIFDLKSMDRFYLVHSNDNTELTVDVLGDTGIDSETFVIDLSTGAAFGITQRVVDSEIQANTFRLKFSNNAASKPWEVLGFGLGFRGLGLMDYDE